MENKQDKADSYSASQQLSFHLQSEFIHLYQLLKLEGLVSSGGEAKVRINNGEVLVNGYEETQKRKKIVTGDCICIGDTVIKVV